MSDTSPIDQKLTSLFRDAMFQRAFGPEFGVGENNQNISRFVLTRDFQDILGQVDKENMNQLLKVYAIMIVSSSKDTENVRSLMKNITWTDDSRKFSFDRVTNGDVISAWKDLEETDKSSDGETSMGDVVASLFSGSEGPTSGATSFTKTDKGPSAQISQIDPGDKYVLETGQKAKVAFDQAPKQGQMALSLRFVEAPKPILPNPTTAIVKAAQMTMDMKRTLGAVDAASGITPEYSALIMNAAHPVIQKIENRPYEIKRDISDQANKKTDVDKDYQKQKGMFDDGPRPKWG